MPGKDAEAPCTAIFCPIYLWKSRNRWQGIEICGRDAYCRPMVSIRAYNPDSDGDLNAITAIYGHHVSFGRASFETEPPSLHDMRSRLAALAAEGYPALVAELDGEIAGYAYAGRHKAREAYRLTVEDSIYVHHDMARRGVGRALLAALVAECRAAGFRQMMAVIGDSENTGSIELHRALGFRHIGTACGIGFKFGVFLDVVYMQLALSET